MAHAIKCFSLLLGARNTPKGSKRFSQEDDALIRKITCRHFANGFTILNADGGWFNPQKRKFVKEQSRQILVCTFSSARVRRWCDELGAALQQAELLVIEIGRAFTFAIKVKTSARNRPRRLT